MIEAGLRNLIVTSEVFTEIAGTRLFEVLLPKESQLPAATYQVIATRPLYALEQRINFTEITVQIDTWDDTYGQAKSLAKTIEAILDNYSGQLSDGSKVQGIQLYQQLDMYEAGARIFRVMSQYTIQYSEPSSAQ